MYDTPNAGMPKQTTVLSGLRLLSGHSKKESEYG